MISSCILRKKRINAFARTVWPDDQATPWFRSSPENSKKLQEITKQLAEDESYTFPRAGLRINAIEEIIRKFMQERRRKENDPLSSQSDQDSGESGSRGSSPSILSAWQGKAQNYEAYFIGGKLLLVLLFSCHQGILHYFITLHNISRMNNSQNFSPKIAKRNFYDTGM